MMDFAAMVAASPPFAELCSAEQASAVAKALFLAHMDAELKGNIAARIFRNGDLGSVAAAHGIDLKVARETADGPMIV